SPKTSNGATTSMSSRCCTMCAEKSASLMASSGDARASTSTASAAAKHEIWRRWMTRPWPAERQRRRTPRAYHAARTPMPVTTAGSTLHARQIPAGLGAIETRRNDEQREAAQHDRQGEQSARQHARIRHEARAPLCRIEHRAVSTLHFSLRQPPASPRDQACHDRAAERGDVHDEGDQPGAAKGRREERQGLRKTEMRGDGVVDQLLQTPEERAAKQPEPECARAHPIPM